MKTKTLVTPTPTRFAGTPLDIYGHHQGRAGGSVITHIFGCKIMDIEKAMSIVYPNKYTDIKVEQKQECDKWDPLNITCYYSEAHVCDSNKYGCLFKTKSPTYHC